MIGSSKGGQVEASNRVRLQPYGLLQGKKAEILNRRRKRRSEAKEFQWLLDCHIMPVSVQYIHIFCAKKVCSELTQVWMTTRETSVSARERISTLPFAAFKQISSVVRTGCCTLSLFSFRSCTKVLEHWVIISPHARFSRAFRTPSVSTWTHSLL